MTTLAKHMIVARVDNCPPMLEKIMYTSWSSQLTDQEKLQDDCDVGATNIVLQGVSPDVYSLVNHHNVAKEIWDRQPQAEFSQLDTSLAVASFLLGDDPISSLNKAMAFLSTAITSRFPTTNNQLKTSYNPRNQATIQDGRVTVQQVKGKHRQMFAGMGSKIYATSSVINRNGGNNATVQARVVRCYNCQGEGHMARQCTQPNRPRNLAWFKDKILLVQAQEAGQVLDEEKLAFLEDSRVAKSQDTQTTITYNAAFQTDDLDAFDSDYNEAPGAKVVLMANLSSYDSNVISKVPISETNQDNSVLDNCVQEMYYSKEPAFDPASNIEITSDSNIISYDQYLKETESAAVQNNTSNEQQNAVIISVFEEITNRVAKCNAESVQNKNVNESLTTELDRYKERHFQKHFVPQKELSAEQAFWLPFSNLISEQLVVPPTPVKIEVVKERTTPSTITEGAWGFEHTKEVFITQVIPFLNSLRESFKDFDNGLHDELNEVKIIFNQMEAAVEQCFVDKKCFEIQKKELLLENDQLLELIISQDLVHNVLNSLEFIDECESMRKSWCEEYNMNLTLEAKLSK
ncbi:retrovirus-related pol polyprotein from transposon TNT 1-94 [Tanacetum coccineum]